MKSCTNTVTVNSATEPVNSSVTDYSTTSPSSSFVDFILRRLRVAELRAKVVANEIEATATALSAGMISVETALLHLHESGVAELIPTSS